MSRMISKLYKVALAVSLPALLYSCKAKDNYQGLEYAPNMYHSVAYEPLKQITDKNAGRFVSNRADGNGEYYNSNEYNPHSMNMRTPPANTVPRNKNGFLPYRIPAENIDYAAEVMKNPLPDTEAIVNKGAILYAKFCQPCHGQSGQGDGSVGKVFKGVPAYNKGRVATVSEGHIFHVITYGKGRMGAHGSQLNQQERWEIVRFVQTLQK